MRPTDFGPLTIDLAEEVVAFADAVHLMSRTTAKVKEGYHTRASGAITASFHTDKSR
jgi:hypothetical protein